MRFLKLTNQAGRPVLVNPAQILTVVVKDTGDKNILLCVWSLGDETASYYRPIDDLGAVLSEAQIQTDLAEWGYEVLLERFESYARKRGA